MKRIILAPDSFKGTLSAAEVCTVEAAVIKRLCPAAEVICVPMADGGEGLVESVLRTAGGTKHVAVVTAPLGGTVAAAYGVLPDGSAVMEMAAAAGLPLVTGREDPLHTTSRGVGEMILDAARRGIRKIMLGLGGSCTNDCGVGMAGALGFRFLDAAGEAVEPLAVNLGRIEAIEAPDTKLPVSIEAACDVDNPLTGPSGATYTFGPQKGADADMLAQLEQGMKHFACVLARFAGVPSAEVAGAGAAGGMGAAVLLLLGGKLRSGVELLLDAVRFDELLIGADAVFTGEGRVDWQSAHGKVPMGVGLRCKKAGVPCAALCGSIGKDAQAVYDCGITAAFSAVPGAATFAEIQKNGRENLAFLTESVLRLLLAARNETPNA